MVAYYFASVFGPLVLRSRWLVLRNPTVPHLKGDRILDRVFLWVPTHHH